MLSLTGLIYILICFYFSRLALASSKRTILEDQIVLKRFIYKSYQACTASNTVGRYYDKDVFLIFYKIEIQYIQKQLFAHNIILRMM